eukprot:snap_masked-scaffold_75-processed-gene-0.47-mRNA-1 protein AED:1.00 eAED:1.00 QI:0/-1/0/0/-1/1/1/0/61
MIRNSEDSFVFMVKAVHVAGKPVKHYKYMFFYHNNAQIYKNIFYFKGSSFDQANVNEGETF